MKNSWGQELTVGAVVYRGARDGNSSEYKVGVVQSLKVGKPPRVKWMYEASVRWIRVDGEQVRVPSLWKMTNSSGSPSLESLIVVGLDIEELERQAQFYKSFDADMDFSSMQEFEHALETFTM